MTVLGKYKTKDKKVLGQAQTTFFIPDFVLSQNYYYVKKDLKLFTIRKVRTKDVLIINLQGEEVEFLTETMIVYHLTSEYNFTRSPFAFPEKTNLCDNGQMFSVCFIKSTL